MRESGGKRKEARTIERFMPNFINEPKRERYPSYSACLGIL